LFELLLVLLLLKKRYSNIPVNEFEDISGLFEIADKDGGMMLS
jgi:hypothetical protein